MLKRILSIVLVVLFSGTMVVGVSAAKKKTASVASKIVYVCNAKKAATIKKPQRAKIIDCSKRKVAHVPQKKKTKVAKASEKPKAKPPLPLDGVTWLTRLLLVEAGLEDEKSRMAVLWIPVRYAKIQKRSLYAEIVTSKRYSGINCKRCLQVAIQTTGEDWKIAKAQAAAMIQNPKPPDPRLKYATTYVRWAHASENGADWIRKYTCPLDPEAKSDLQIGNHIFREECAQQRSRGVVIPWPPKPRVPTQLVAGRSVKGSQTEID